MEEDRSQIPGQKRVQNAGGSYTLLTENDDGSVGYKTIHPSMNPDGLDTSRRRGSGTLYPGQMRQELNKALGAGDGSKTDLLARGMDTFSRLVDDES